MPMQVPISRTPGTRVSGQQQGYADAASGLDLSPITGTLRAFAKEIEDERKNTEAFDLQRFY
jgi:hypothetical protein